MADSGVPAVGTGTQTTVGTKGGAAPGAAAGAGADQAPTLGALAPGLPMRWGLRIGRKSAGVVWSLSECPAGRE